ncbi:MAG: Tryptophan-tRNA ligase [Parcubacteria group bacterium GW2011_GWA2_31_28]|nr:MAG: Tryptophan-tRNA ligase [Parcubacteria group bacterium GW2011_GWA2_31_28]
MKKIIFSGIQSTGNLHIGNYFGAIKNWIELQNKEIAIFCIVDLHSITIPQNPETLRRNTFDIAAIYLACGIDPKKSIIFTQSDVPAHSELAWILSTKTGIGQMERMTQYKDKSLKNKNNINMGLMCYPMLMAADILLYNTDLVPVGDDQKQHIEYARDIAQRFNKLYGNIFTVPDVYISKIGTRIMGLDNTIDKMSKSADSQLNYIGLLDNPENIREKIKKAVTDSGSEILFSKEKPAISNLLTIYSLSSGKRIKELENKYRGKGYSDFKKDLAEAIIKFLTPIQKEFYKLQKNKSKINDILENGAKKAKIIANKKLNEIKKKIGLGYL